MSGGAVPPAGWPGPTWLRLVSLRLRQKEELLERGRVRVPLARFLWSFRA